MFRSTACVVVGLSCASALRCTDVRPKESKRKFVSAVLEAHIEQMASESSDKELACLFRNALPNTLDTTVRFSREDGSDAFLVTGDIEAPEAREEARAMRKGLLAQTEALIVAVEGHIARIDAL